VRGGSTRSLFATDRADELSFDDEKRMHHGGDFPMIHSTVTLNDQPAEPRLLLERNVRLYAGLVQGIMPQLSPMEPAALARQYGTMMQEEHGVSKWLSSAHILAIGLRQIQEHLERLRRLKGAGFRTSQIAQAAEQFFRAYKAADVSNLRDLLEHQAGYIVGEGKKGKGKKWKWHLIVDVTEPVSFGNDPSGEVWVSIFGKRCRVDPIVRAAAALEVALREVSRPIQEGGDPTRTVTVALPVPGGPTLPFSLTEEGARDVLECLLSHEENSDEYRTVVNLLRRALQPGIRAPIQSDREGT
jgi:hypothetical protein